MPPVALAKGGYYTKCIMQKIQQLKNLLLSIQKQTALAQRLVAEVLGERTASAPRSLAIPDSLQQTILKDQEIIEGVFDGEQMIGPDGKKYKVPANYASKSKLVEGDILKLTINSSGEFIYKQIKPTARQHLKGVLKLDQESENFYVLADGRDYKVLTASVTYFKGDSGDETVIIVPDHKNSRWAAVENIIKDETDKSNQTEAEKSATENHSPEEKIFSPKAHPAGVDDLLKSQLAEEEGLEEI